MLSLPTSPCLPPIALDYKLIYWGQGGVRILVNTTGSFIGRKMEEIKKEGIGWGGPGRRGGEKKRDGRGNA